MFPLAQHRLKVQPCVGFCFFIALTHYNNQRKRIQIVNRMMQGSSPVKRDERFSSRIIFLPKEMLK
ncbi:hypothetical protein D5396_00015 [Rahnella inusitata]|uniref:Uncharacterized protein n=1 Tax=Rahnella inusitata TaxID=58169 RepID=A0ABX9P5X9_9GAMM|nr:hypothetical protein D5396_00015 [Rahnella inusitata]